MDEKFTQSLSRGAQPVLSIPKESRSNMKKYQSKLFLTILAAVAVELVMVYIFHGHFLEKLAWIGESITGVVAVTALLGFLYQVERDEDLSATDLIGFFREKVIPQKKIFDNSIKETKETYTKPNLVKLDKFSLLWLRLNYRKNGNNPINFYIKYPNVEQEVMNFFNVLEEFALKVEYMKQFEHPALSSIKAAFVLCVEENADWILSFMLIHPDGYPGVRKLYDKWKDFGERDSLEEQEKKIKDRISTQLNAETKN